MSKKPLNRMTGHQQLVNDVKFSPDMRVLASASFDKSIKLWDGRTGELYLQIRRFCSRKVSDFIKGARNSLYQFQRH